jgi:hypothetical protein
MSIGEEMMDIREKGRKREETRNQKSITEKW